MLQDEYYRIYLDGKIRVNEGDIEKKDLEAKCLEIEKKIQDICGKLADCYYEQKKYTKAEPLYQEVLPFRERTLGPDHSDTVHTRDMLGDCYYEQGEYTKAEPLYREALDIRERVGTWNYDYLSIVFTCERLGDCYYEQDEYTKAESLYQKVLGMGDYSEYGVRIGEKLRNCSKSKYEKNKKKIIKEEIDKFGRDIDNTVNEIDKLLKNSKSDIMLDAYARVSR